jgi:hypothetical protein
MTDHPIRYFPDDAAVRRVGDGLLAHDLPRPEWTHEAHLAACLWLVRERTDIDLDARIATIISGYNVAVGGVNDDGQGYHDTITRTYLAGVGAFLRDRPWAEPLALAVNALLASEVGCARLAAAVLLARAAVLGGGAPHLRSARPVSAAMIPRVV